MSLSVASLGTVARGSPGRSGRVSELRSADGSCASKQVRSTSPRSQYALRHQASHFVVIGTKVAARSRGYCGLPQRCAKRPSDQRHTHVAYPWYTVRDASNENHEPVAVGIGLLRLLSDASATYLPTWHVLRRSTPFRGDPIRARQTPEFSPSRTLLVAAAVEPFRGGLAAARARALALLSRRVRAGPSSPGDTERQRCDGRDTRGRDRSAPVYEAPSRLGEPTRKTHARVSPAMAPSRGAARRSGRFGPCREGLHADRKSAPSPR